MVDLPLLREITEYLLAVLPPLLTLVATSLGFSIVIGVITTELTRDIDGHGSSVDSLLSHRLLHVCFGMGLIAGAYALLLHRSLVQLIATVGVAAAAGAIGWRTLGTSRYASRIASHVSVPTIVREVGPMLGVVGIVVAMYFGYIAYRVHVTITAGLTPAERRLVEPYATVFAIKFVLPLYGVLVVALALVLGLMMFWDWAESWLADEIAQRSPATTSPGEWGTLHDWRQRTWMWGGTLIAVGAFGWIILRPSAVDLVEALIGGLALIETGMIFDAVRSLRRVQDEKYPQSVIESELKLQVAETVLYVFSIGAVVLIGAAMADVFVASFYHSVLATAVEEMPPTVAATLSGGTNSPAVALQYFSFYGSGHTFFDLTVRLIKIILPAIVGVFLLPLAVKYLYFREYRTVVITVLALAGVLLLHIIIELVVSGEITHLTAISLTSLIPTVSAGLSGSAVEWVQEELGHAHCASCDGRVDRSSNYCEHCGARLVACPHCHEFSALEEDACVVCGERVSSE